RRPQRRGRGHEPGCRADVDLDFQQASGGVRGPTKPHAVGSDVGALRSAQRGATTDEAVLSESLSGPDDLPVLRVQRYDPVVPELANRVRSGVHEHLPHPVETPRIGIEAVHPAVMEVPEGACDNVLDLGRSTRRLPFEGEGPERPVLSIEREDVGLYSSGPRGECPEGEGVREPFRPRDLLCPCRIARRIVGRKAYVAVELVARSSSGAVLVLVEVTGESGARTRRRIVARIAAGELTLHDIVTVQVVHDDRVLRGSARVEVDL